MRRQVVTTITPKKRLVKGWFYIDVLKAVTADVDRDAAIFAVPEERKLKENFDKDIKLDLSSPELEYEQLIFPLNKVFSNDEWLQGFWKFWSGKGKSDPVDLYFRFRNEILRNFTEYTGGLHECFIPQPQLGLKHNRSVSS